MADFYSGVIYVFVDVKIKKIESSLNDYNQQGSKTHDNFLRLGIYLMWK